MSTPRRPRGGRTTQVHLIAEHGGDSMLPRLGMTRALQRHYERPAPPPTKTAN